jgi:amino acid adenylation domain-containing protein/non-ribosomal peptide synthase protein (TIGR01720 family)
LAQQLRALPQPTLSFNYLGQLSQTIDASKLLEPASEFAGEEVDPRTRRPHLLDVNASVIEDQLRVQWTYSTNVHERSEIECLASMYVAALAQLVEHCLAPDVGGYTPSDFPLVRINQQQLDNLLADQKVDDIYPLSSMQEGILFHSIYDPELREYFIQINCTFDGALNEPALKRAWEEVVKRHSVLRTFFVWQDLQEPVQIVRQHVALPWLSLDWRALAPALQQQQLAEFLAADLARGFDLQQPPLMRMALIRLADDSHQFVWSFHHLLLDGWSTPLVIKEAFTFYEGICQGRRVELSAVRPYREYIRWLQTQELGAAERFWRELLKGFTAPTALGIDRPAEVQERSEGTERYVEHQVRLTAKATEELQQLARTWRVTLNTVVQGAWALLLSRYSGSEDVVFGATVSGRPASLPGIEEMVGLFINSLPVRVEVKSEDRVGEYLRRLQEQQVEIRQYEHSPLVEVQRWSEVPKGMPLFETIIAFENYPVGEALEDRGGVEVRDVKRVENNNYPLTLIVTPGQELILQLIHNSERYERESIGRMMGHLEVVLHEMAVQSSRKLASISMLTDSELEQLLFKCNRNRSEFPQEQCLHQLFEAQVELSPESVAATCEEQSLTYYELNVRANQLAHYLQKLGVGPEVMVALCLERSLEMIVAQLAVLKAGGVYVPIDPSCPTARLAWMCEDTNAMILLTQESVSKTVPATCTHVIRLDSEWEAIAAECELNPVSTAVAENAAYVIYTSGSTGKSKGVVVTHANVLRLFAATRSWVNFDEHDVGTLFHSYAFDFSVWELWGALLHGGRLVVVSYWVSRSPEAFHRLLADEQVTILNQTPSGFRQLMLVEETFSRSEELNLRLVIFGGEALELQSLEQWFARHTRQPVRLVNMYGITETTVHVTHHTVTERELAAPRGSVIGVPISDLQVYLLDQHLFPAPLGVTGEIYVGGPGVARGYLRQPALTAERFIPHPFSQKNGERLYRSGDLGRYLPNGEIEYGGRIDSQVKIRGIRVELAEIELVLSAHPAVRECVVVARQDFSEHKRIVSYVVLHQGTTVNAGELRTYMLEKLPEYMVPSHIVLLSSFPLTPNGKIDRKALPDPHYVSLRSRVEQTLVDAPPLTPAERQRILYEWNDTRVEYPRERKLHELFEARAEETPDAVAVVFEGEQLSYRELNARANQLAHHLQGQGIGAEVLVGVLMERSLEMVIALYAILKAGGAYVPLEPTYPRERLAFMLSDLRMPVVLTQQRFAGVLSEPGAQVVPVDTDWSTFAGEPVDNPGVALTSLNVAYAIYTSGSTGQPKGVMNTHLGICNRLLWMQEAYQLKAGEVVLQKTPFSFDVSVWEFFWPLLTGARLVVAKPGGHRDNAYLIDLIKREQVTTLHFVPSMLQVFLEAERARECASLKRVICSGEALSRELQERYYERMPGELHNLYGPTEAAVDVTFWKCDSTKYPDIVPIGFPIANTQLYLLDKHLEPMPCSVAGELYIGGDGLARGYFNRPELTAEKFLPHPFGERGGERLYRTGDLASYLPDGAIEYLGRTDNQIKLRGFRVEPGEVEAMLNQHPGIINSVVATRENGNGEQRLVGYTMQKPGVVLSSSELRTYLLGKLPEHMIPATFITLDALPLTPNGKLDKEALPAPDWSLPKLDESYIPPRTQREILLAQIWSEVLGAKRVGIHDNFFELGGDSILSIKIMARANRAGLKLLPRQFFQHPTVAGLAAVAGTAQAKQSEQGQVSGAAPLTPIQRWFFEQELAVPAHYNQSLLLQTRRPLQAEALRATVRGLLRQHDALRLRFERGAEGEWRQWHAALSEEMVKQSCAVIDLSSVADEELPAAITAKAEEVQRSLDLEHGPVLRVVWMETGEGRSGRLLLVAHHLVVDGVSWRVLLEDLERGYEQAAGGQAVELGTKTSSYREWAEALVAEVERGLGAAEEQYWTSVADAPVTLIPGGNIPGGGTVGSAQRVEVGLSGERTLKLLQEVPAAYNTQINDVLVTALARTLCWWTTKAHSSENGAGAAVLVELEGHGREEISRSVDVSRTVGWFTSIYPVVLESSAAEEVGPALKRIKEQLRAVPRRGLGFGLLHYLGNGEVSARLREMRRAQVGFNYLGQLDQVLGKERWLGIAGGSAGAERDGSAQRVHALEVSGYVAGGELRLGWEYDAERYTREEMETVAERYRQELEALIAHCVSEEAGGFTPSDFPLADLNQRALDRIAANDGLINDIYTVTPLQAGLLFHSLYAPSSGEYFVQLNCTLSGKVNPEALQQAWQEVVNRHCVLRTFFVWQDLKEPVQIVRQHVQPPWLSLDWRALAPALQQQQLSEFLAADLARGFDLQQAPLMRVALIHLADETYHFVWSCHHLLLDGWSTALVIKEVFTFYEGLSQGRRVELEAVRPYREYIRWLRGQKLGAAERFWRELLKGFSTPTALGIERRVSTVEEVEEQYEGQEVQLTAEATAELQQVARTYQVTLNTVVQGAWALLLRRYSGSEDVVFGATVSGRPPGLPGVEEMVGVFINTLPVRTAVKREERVGEYLRGLQEQQVEMRQYEYSPLVEVQGWSEVGRGVRLFDTIMVFENYPVDEALRERSGRLKVDNVYTVERNNYPLALIALPAQQMVLQLKYNTGRYESASIARMLQHLVIVLGGISAQPEPRIADVPLLTTTEEQQILFEWNETAAVYPRELSLSELFEAQVARTPEALALLFKDTALSYRELNERANQLARYLQHTGVGPEVLVGILMNPSVEMIVAVLGILKAGGAYVPLDPSYPQERLAFKVQDSGIQLLLTRERLSGVAGEYAGPTLSLTQQWDLVTDESVANVASSAHPENLAYVIYTSGSTGRPKGVMIQQRSVVNFATALQHSIYREYGAGLRIGLSASLAFDASVQQVVQLLHGHTLCILPKEARANGQQLLSYIKRYRLDGLDCTPSHLRLLGASGVEELMALAPQLVLVGGEALEETVWPQLAGNRETRFFNVYGPTECTVDAIVSEVRPELPASTIGRPLANMQVYLLDQRQQPVGIEIAGEICLGGEGVGRGYLRAPELTAERFIPHPYSATEGARLYRTGDVARYLSDGNIEHLGRLDDQVKLRGYRIELGEIEAVVSEHPTVRQAVVTVREDQPGDKRLVTYIVAETNPPPGTKELREFIRNKLPDYMIPTAFVMLESLPLNSHGKVDRGALPAPDGLRPELDTSYVVPRTEAERNIAEVWQEVLRLESVGIFDNFFDLGGHSLLMIQIHDKLREKFKFEVSMVELFEYPSINSLAEHLNRQKNVTSLQDENLVLAAKLREGRNRLRQQRATRA